MSGRKIIDALKDAQAGNFSRVTIDGQVWVRATDLAADQQQIMSVNNAMRDLLNEAVANKAGTRALELSCPRWGERVRKVVAP